MLSDLLTTDLFRSGIRLSTPLLFAGIGSALCGRAGVLNLAIEAKVLVGAFVAIFTSYIVGSTTLGIGAAAIVGASIGLGLGVALDRLDIDLVIVAIALNLLAIELTVFLMRTWFDGVGTWSDPSVQRLSDIDIPLLKHIPIAGDVLSGYNALVYLSWFALFGYGLVFRTRFGRHLVAVGEMPTAAEAVGINVSRTRTTSLVVAGALAGIGGAYLSVANLALFTRNISDDRGWIAITAALLALNRPIGLFFAVYLFGFADALSVRLQVTTDVSPSLIQFLPQLLALAAIIVVGARTLRPSRRTQHSRQDDEHDSTSIADDRINTPNNN